MVLDNKIKLINNNEFKSLKIMCDQNQLGRVFLNILKNSYESSVKKTKIILVEVIKKKSDIIINIEDNGS